MGLDPSSRARLNNFMEHLRAGVARFYATPPAGRPGNRRACGRTALPPVEVVRDRMVRWLAFHGVTPPGPLARCLGLPISLVLQAAADCDLVSAGPSGLSLTPAGWRSLSAADY